MKCQGDFLPSRDRIAFLRSINCWIISRDIALQVAGASIKTVPLGAFFFNRITVGDESLTGLKSELLLDRREPASDQRRAFHVRDILDAAGIRCGRETQHQVLFRG